MSAPKKTVRRNTDEPGRDRGLGQDVLPDVAPDVDSPKAQTSRVVAKVPKTTAETPMARLDPQQLLDIAGMDPDEIARLVNESMQGPLIQVGDRARGRVTRLGSADIFIDLGGKSEATMPRDEWPEATLGEDFDGWVAGVDENGISVTKKLSGNAASAALDAAKITGAPLEGKVMSRNAGGFEVRIGGERAFCPTSHMSRLREVDMDAYVGQTLMFKVLETGEKTVVSRRAIQDEEVKGKADAFWAKVEVGQTYTGTIRNVQSFGAFVDVGGVDGLVPRREIGWVRGADPTEVLQVGQKLEVHVLDIDFTARKLTFSAKDPGQSPWAAVGNQFTEGGVYSGTVKKVTDFGAFVEIGVGVQGLLRTPRHIPLPSVGETIDVKVTQVEPDRQRISLQLASSNEPAAPLTGVEVTGTVRDVNHAGVFVDLEDGRQAFLPGTNVNLPAGTMLIQRFRKGRKITAKVSDVDMRGRINLTQLDIQEESAWRSEMAKTQPDARLTTLGTFGDLFKGMSLPTAPAKPAAPAPKPKAAKK